MGSRSGGSTVSLIAFRFKSSNLGTAARWARRVRREADEHLRVVFAGSWREPEPEGDDRHSND
jgi:hypothetical protein